MTPHDLTGRTFGMLTAIRRHPSPGKARWLCVCKCGETSTPRENNLLFARTRSCGCQRRNAGARNNRTHGKSDTHLYWVWAKMRRRCQSPRDPKWSHYGGRGISVCPRWLGPEGFANFAQDMGTPDKGLSLDRINNDGNYSPDNCRWATPSEQRANQREKTNERVTIFGITQTRPQWARQLGLTLSAFYQRDRNARLRGVPRETTFANWSPWSEPFSGAYP